MKEAEKQRQTTDAAYGQPVRENREHPEKVQTGGCLHCGHRNPEDARFCEECGSPLNAVPCPQCGAPIPEGGDICESCGARLHPDQCAFCGTELEAGAEFCSECGNPARGILCPHCGTLSFFDYCPQCHTPLTDQANALVDSLNEDPQISEWLQAKEEFQHIEETIHALDEASSATRIIGALSKEMEEEYFGAPPLTEKKPIFSPRRFFSSSPKKESRPKEEYRKKQRSREKLESLKKKQQELAKKLKEQPPLPESLTGNQEVRRLQMSVKPPRTIGWKCNAYKNIHQDPMHCTRPGDGGHWIMEGDE